MKNLVIVGAMLVIGLGNAEIRFTKEIAISGMALAALVGVILNVILRPKDQEKPPLQAKPMKTPPVDNQHSP